MKIMKIIIIFKFWEGAYLIETHEFYELFELYFGFSKSFSTYKNTHTLKVSSFYFLADDTKIQFKILKHFNDYCTLLNVIIEVSHVLNSLDPLP